MLHPPDDNFFMQQALREAQNAFQANEVPIGCVIVREGKVIGRGSNRMETLKDPTAHAEILAIGAACNSVENWRLDGCTLYCTLEPCPMCAGAILNGRISRVVYGAKDKRLGALGSVCNLLNPNALGRQIETVGEVLSEECLSIIQAFFHEVRAKKKNNF